MKMPMPFKRKPTSQPTATEGLRSWADLLIDDPSVTVWVSQQGEVYLTRTAKNGYRHYVDTTQTCPPPPPQ